MTEPTVGGHSRKVVLVVVLTATTAIGAHFSGVAEVPGFPDRQLSDVSTATQSTATTTEDVVDSSRPGSSSTSAPTTEAIAFPATQDREANISETTTSVPSPPSTEAASTAPSTTAAIVANSLDEGTPVSSTVAPTSAAPTTSTAATDPDEAVDVTDEEQPAEETPATFRAALQRELTRAEEQVPAEVEAELRRIQGEIERLETECYPAAEVQENEIIARYAPLVADAEEQLANADPADDAYEGLELALIDLQSDRDVEIAEVHMACDWAIQELDFEMFDVEMAAFDAVDELEAELVARYNARYPDQPIDWL